MAVLALIIWLGLNYRKLLSCFATTAAQPKTVASPLRVFGLDVRAASLPDDPAEAALALCLAHNYRQGLAILYRATLVALLQQGLKLKASHTEEDCLALATRLPLSLAAQDYLRQLTHTWQQLAYGHQAPAPSQAEQLCRQWALHWSIQAQPMLKRLPDHLRAPVWLALLGLLLLAAYWLLFTGNTRKWTKA